MVNNKFQDELDKLEQLLNKLNKKNNNRKSQRGGDATDPGLFDQLASTETFEQKSEQEESPGNTQSGGAKKKAKKTAKKTVKKEVKKTVKKGKKSQKGGSEPDENDLNTMEPMEPMDHMAGGRRNQRQQQQRQQQRQRAGVKSEDRPARHFVVVMVNGKEINEDDAPKIKLYLVTKTGKLNKQGPRDAASKAFSKLCRKYGKKEECSLSFSIRETTRASEFEHKGKMHRLTGENKHHNYQGKRVKLSKEEQEATKRKLKNGNFIINKYRNELKSKGSEKTKHQKGGWTFYS